MYIYVALNDFQPDNYDAIRYNILILIYLINYYISEFVDKYGQGETYEIYCPKCTYPIEIDTTGVHYGVLGSIRIYTRVNGYECPKCFYKEAPRPGILKYLYISS